MDVAILRSVTLMRSSTHAFVHRPSKGQPGYFEYPLCMMQTKVTRACAQAAHLRLMHHARALYSLPLTTRGLTRVQAKMSKHVLTLGKLAPPHVRWSVLLSQQLMHTSCYAIHYTAPIFKHCIASNWLL